MTYPAFTLGVVLLGIALGCSYVAGYYAGLHEGWHRGLRKHYSPIPSAWRVRR